MSDLATALAAGERSLGTYNGIHILRETIAVRNAGDGLSKAMKFNALEGENDLRLGRHKVYVVLECDVVDHQHPLVKGADDLCERKVILRAGDATIIDGDVVAEQLARQKEKVVEAEERARALKGEKTLPGLGLVDGFDETPEMQVLSMHHKAGLHADALAEGCPECDLERDAAAAEASEEG